MEKELYRYLRFLGLKVSRDYCLEFVRSHPDYPSLLSCIDFITSLGLKCETIRSVDAKDIKRLNPPLLIHKDSNGGEIVFIKTISDLNKYSNGWTGITLHIPEVQEVKSSENHKKLAEERAKDTNWLMASIPVFALLALFFSTISFQETLRAVTTLLGILVGYFLIAKDLGINYGVVDRFCGSSKKESSGCDTILSSSAASIFGINLSEVVLAFFSSQLLLVIISETTTNSFDQTLTLLPIGASPAIILSIVYQKFVAKSWCRLCLMVSSLLLAQIFIEIYLLNFSLELPNPTQILIAGLLLTTVLGIIRLVKNLIKNYNKLTIKLLRSQRITNNPKTFSVILKNEREINNTFFEKEITIGNKNAPINLVMASNLYCEPCKDFHEELDVLIENYPDLINVSMRFLLSGSDIQRSPSTTQYIIEYWLTNCYGKDNESNKTAELFKSWYSLMDLDQFKKQYKVDEDRMSSESVKIESAHYSWIEVANVEKTPTLFINGFKLPLNYDLENLNRLIPGFAEEIEKHKTIV